MYITTRFQVTAAVAALAVGGALIALHLNESGRAGVHGPYVALGDSYTAAPGLPAQQATPAGCERSDRNYPTLVARSLQLDPADFRDVSCSGATTSDLSAEQKTSDGVNPAQLSALSTATRLVTLGIGGNDIGFGSLVTGCLVTGLSHLAITDLPGGTTCQDWNTLGGVDRIDQKIRAAGESLTRVLAEIERRAPQAEVLVVGYPAILPDDGVSCPAEMPVAAGDVSYLREKEQGLNRMLADQARAAGAGYVDTYGPSSGHDVCSGPANRWVEPVTDRAAPVHPNEQGERGMADAVLKTLG